MELMAENKLKRHCKYPIKVIAQLLQANVGVLTSSDDRKIILET